jgi:hypothetical protein
MHSLSPRFFGRLGVALVLAAAPDCTMVDHHQMQLKPRAPAPSAPSLPLVLVEWADD